MRDYVEERIRKTVKPTDGDKISKRFKGIEEVLLKMYDESLEQNQVMFYLCHIALLTQGSVIDDVILAWGTKASIKMMLAATKRAFNNPMNTIDVNTPIPIVSIFDHHEKYKNIANALENLHNRYPNIRLYCFISVKEKRDLSTALFAHGELNVLAKMQSFVGTLLEMPENIQDEHIVRWQMTSFQ